jgi:hypothetical protein
MHRSQKEKKTRGEAVFRMPVYGPPESGSSIICTDPDPSINKQKKVEKTLISAVL